MVRSIVTLLAGAVAVSAMATTPEPPKPEKAKPLNEIDQLRQNVWEHYRQGRDENRVSKRSPEFLSMVEEERRERIIYGADDRYDVYEISDPMLLEWAQACAVVVPFSSMTFNGNGTVTLAATPWTTAGFGSLCTDEPFYGQLRVGFCSAFLVGTDLVVTAGHCVSASNVGNTAYVFGYDQRSSTLGPLTTVPGDHVYVIDEIINRALGGGLDHTLSRVDRPVVGWNPMPIRRTGEVVGGEPLMMIGHPAALPKKLAGGAEVKEPRPGQGFFTANVDAYGGNSGSMVINMNTGEVEGILVRGNTDYTTQGGCVVSNWCPDSGCPTWEELSKIAPLKDLIPPLGISITNPASVTGFGPVGGPFIDAGVVYTMSNSTPSNLAYTVTVSGSYPILINGMSGNFAGTLNAGSSLDLNVAPAASVGSLGAGSYTATIEIFDVANNRTTTREKTIEIGLPRIEVTPTDDIFASGPEGGPFINASRTYTITNPRNFPVSFSVSASQSWITLNGGSGPVSGTLPGLGSMQMVTVGLSAAAESFPINPYSGSVSFANTSGSLGSTSISYNLQVGMIEIMSTDVPVPILDNTTSESTLEILDAFCITDLDVIVDISHTFIGDLHVDIIGPDGTEVRLHNRTGGSTDDIMTIYDDATNPPSGPGMLSDFNFKGAQGVWTLRVRDNANLDTGQINGWGLIISAATDCPPSAGDQTIEVAASTPVTFDLSGTLNGPTGSFIITSLPAAGVLRDAGTNAVINSTPYTLAGSQRSVSYDPGMVTGSTSFTWDAMNVAGTASGTTKLLIGSPSVAAEFNLDTNPGWTTQGLWAWGVSAGLSGDPSSAYTGTNIYGYNLNGAYTNNMPETNLTTTAINCTGLGGTTLSFARWLSIESSVWDRAHIDVSNDGVNFTRIWSHSGPTVANPGSWTVVSYDISAIADDQPTVYIRWVMGTTDSSVVHGGWSIDDITISGFQPITSDPGPAGCNPADLNSAAASSPASPVWGVPDGILTPTDFSAFVTFFSSGDLRADINSATASSPASPNFGVPDGILTPTDFSAFIAYFSAGCPCTLPGCP